MSKLLTEDIISGNNILQLQAITSNNTINKYTTYN